VSDLRNIWVDLIDKRLWPIAVGLVLALIAVPVVLAKGSKAPPPPAKVAANSGPRLPGAVVTRAADQRIGLSSGKARDPFRPQGFRGTTGAASTATSAAGSRGSSSSSPDSGLISAPGSGSADGGSSGGGSVPNAGRSPGDIVSGGAGNGNAPPLERGPVETRVVVTFGVFGGSLPTLTFAPLTALPPTKAPFLIYIGRAEDHRTAVFSVAGGVGIDRAGDGRCKPSRKLCQFIELKPGGVQDFTVKHTDYELTVLKYVRS
jgi:hypothetical protein